MNNVTALPFSRSIREFLFACLLMLCSSAVLFGGGEAKTIDETKPIDEAKPNIVMFFIDDLGSMDLGCYGSEFHDTPNIDSLAKRSVRFTDFYSANPVCSPTRAALMTGKAPQRVGITQWLNQPNDLHLPLEEVTIGEALASAGYKTGYIGKWHLGDKDNQQPREQGFTWMRGVNRAGQPGDYFFPFKRKKKKSVVGAIQYSDVPDLEDRKTGDYLTDALTDHAISFITENKDRPFFLCFAHYAVHTPIQAPKELVDRYKEAKSKLKPRNEFVEERNGAKTRVRQSNPTFAAMVSNLDTNVGRVLEHLDTLELSKNTVVIFTSDNGGLSTLKREAPTSCYPLRAGKGWTYEGGIRIPTLISWPEKIKPAVSETPGITMDVYPTILELAGLPQRPKQHLDGHSLVTAINGKPDAELSNRFLAWTYPHNHGSGHSPSNAIREGDWKLIHLTDDKTPNAERYELYNLKDDISENNNLAVKHFERTHAMAKQLSEWLVETTPAKTDVE
ncbi:MAG: sulfatase [Mariniblastus sp.]